jgi:hypothetical protein
MTLYPLSVTHNARIIINQVKVNLIESQTQTDHKSNREIKYD